MSKPRTCQLRRSYTTGSMMEILQQRKQNLTAPFQLYSSGVIFPTNSTKCQHFYHEPLPYAEEDSTQIWECNTKLEAKSRKRFQSEYHNETQTSDFNKPGEMGTHNENDGKEPVSCFMGPNANYAKQTDRKRLSQHETSCSQNHTTMMENNSPRTRTYSMSDKYLKAYSMRQPLCDVLRSTRFRGTDCNFSPSKHLSHIQDLSTFARERISSVSSTNTVQCVDSYDLPGATDCIFNVSPDWSVTAVQAFRLAIAGNNKTTRKLFLDCLLLCGETEDNDDVFDDEEKAEQTISVNYNEERYSLTFWEMEEEENFETTADALITLVDSGDKSWFIQLLRGLRPLSTAVPDTLIAASTSPEINQHCLPDDLSTLDIQFQDVDLQQQSTIGKFVETTLQHLLSMHPTPPQGGGEGGGGILDGLDTVDKQALFRRFFWRPVSATRSCENLLAL